MKSFIFKIFNLILICAVLFIYQGFADTRAKAVTAYEQADQEVAQVQASIDAKNNQAAGGSAAANYKDGEYTGTGTGFGGDVTVKVIIKDGKITEVSLVSADQETTDYINKAVALLDDMVTNQTSEVDTVSGATFSSNGLIEAAENALKEASNE